MKDCGPFWLLLPVAILLGMIGPAAAQEEAIPPDDRWGLSLVWENDTVADTDRHYTNGVMASLLSPQNETLGLPIELWDILPGHGEDDKRRVALHVGQSMFTPEDISVEALIPDERPYGGWLHGGISLVSETRNQLRSLTLDLGVVGPYSLGDETQTFVHELVGAGEPKGWGNQIKNEPAILVAYQQKWRFHKALLPDWDIGVDVMPHVTGAAGNVHTFAGGGATLRLGADLPGDFGPLFNRPGEVGATLFRPQRGFSWYLYAGTEGRYVLRNIFLDGNTFRDSHSVDKKPFVADLQMGLALEFQQVRLSYSFVLRSPEFDEQEESDRFGSLNLTFKF
ncbi:lipid A deacylase LpxR family protein [Limibacillus sp. MBR-115]|uniref:lipid A deacylase LpxR family protein n=1 Tax=Limibacillus sp. MBR-115 TaxID=3156465 RepID=UPI003392BAD2